MAPEIVLNNDYSAAGDVWAFGCVLVHMASGHTPYSHLKLTQAKELFDIIKNQSRSPLETLQKKPAKEVPKAIVALATNCCAPQKASRPSFEEIVKAVDEIVGTKRLGAALAPRA